jgi:hypothetical protein
MRPTGSRENRVDRQQTSLDRSWFINRPSRTMTDGSFKRGGLEHDSLAIIGVYAFDGGHELREFVCRGGQQYNPHLSRATRQSHLA